MENYDPMLLSRRVATARSAGISPAELRTSLWVHDLHGVARPAFVEHDPLTTRLANAVALMSGANAIGGWAALNLQGNTFFDGSADAETERPVLIHCLPGSQLRVRPGICPSESLVHPDETIDLGGYRVATLARAVFDEMCAASHLTAAVIACDMAVSTVAEQPHTTLAAVRRVIDSHHKVRGIVQARLAVASASARSASPGETRTRLLAARHAGLTALAVNQPLFDLDGGLLGIADLYDDATGLVLESDGAAFHGEDARTTDNHRQEGFERTGLVVCRITADDHRVPLVTGARIRAAHADAASGDRRGWTTDLPSWWPTWQHHRRWSSRP